MFKSYKYKGSDEMKFSDWILSIRNKNTNIDDKISDINTGLKGSYEIIMNETQKVITLDKTYEGIFRILVNPAVDPSVLELLNGSLKKPHDDAANDDTANDDTANDTELIKAINFINKNTGDITNINNQLTSILNASP